MKNLLLIALASFALGSCQKMNDLYIPVETHSQATIETSFPGQIQNLGHVFTGTNVTWKIHPLNANNSPLFTYLPNSNSGYCMLMIDNGEVDGLTPITPFRFVVVNFQTFTSKIVTVKQADGNPATYSFGRITRYLFGMDKKFYVATEGSSHGGGHLIQYDPNTQTAVDLGRPFKKGDSYLDIYSLNVGTDGALYGGSFGGEGDVMTFRFKDNNFYVDASPLDNTSRYVTHVAGDSRYTYAVCGKNNWILYATDRQTGQRKTLMYNQGSSTPIDVGSNDDATYAHSVATHYKLSGLSMTSLGEYNRPATNRVTYMPYDFMDANIPQVLWNSAEKKVTYQLKSGLVGSIKVDGLMEDVYPTNGPLIPVDDKIYMASGKQGILSKYTPGGGFETVGSTSMDIHTMAAPKDGSADVNKIFLGGYPKGSLLQYDPATTWTVNIAGFRNENGGFASTSSNPKQSTSFQDADATGANGSMSLLNIAYTKNNFVVGAGNNDRITTSSGRELSMGSFKNGVTKNLFIPEFSQYEFQSLCLSKDGNYAFVGAIPHSGNDGKIYKYDPVSNKVAASWDFPLWGDRSGNFTPFTDDLLVGYIDDVTFLFDLKSGEIIWKQVLGQGQKIYSLSIAPDNSVWIIYMFRQATNFRLAKLLLDVNDSSNIQVSLTPVTELKDQDDDERSKPGGLTFVTRNGITDLYISGLNSLYRLRI